jgi:hypothetical protein
MAFWMQFGCRIGPFFLKSAPFLQGGEQAVQQSEQNKHSSLSLSSNEMYDIRFWWWTRTPISDDESFSPVRVVIYSGASTL